MDIIQKEVSVFKMIKRYYNVLKEMKTLSYTILVIEDEKDIREIIARYLQNEGYDVIESDNGITGLSLFNEYSPELIICDIMMSGIDGFEVLSRIRNISDIPVIMLTAKHTESDRVKGFELGADDYVPKPFSAKELVKRVNVLIKRVYFSNSSGTSISIGEMTLDTNTRKLYKKGKPIDITSREFDIMYVFFKNPNTILSREQLIELAFGYDYEGFDRTIDSHIKKIRQKIEDDTKNPIYLKTKYGAGYIFGGKTHEH